MVEKIGTDLYTEDMLTFKRRWYWTIGAVTECISEAKYLSFLSEQQKKEYFENKQDAPFLLKSKTPNW